MGRDWTARGWVYITLIAALIVIAAFGVFATSAGSSSTALTTNERIFKLERQVARQHTQILNNRGRIQDLEANAQAWLDFYDRQLPLILQCVQERERDEAACLDQHFAGVPR